MTPSDTDLKPKPRSWWVWGFIFLFLAHVALVFWLADRSRPRPFGPRPEPFLYVANDPAAERRLAARAAFANPTLFALPSEMGFSGGAWLSYAPRPLQSSNWADSPRALPLPRDQLGAAFVASAATNAVSDVALLDGLRGFAPLEFIPPRNPISTESVVSIRGALSGRPLAAAEPLPVAHHTDLLTNTVVEIHVNGDGAVESVTLVGECELPQMNQKALEWARTARFVPLPLPRAAREKAVPERGHLVFTWHVAPPSATNATAALTQ